MPALKDKKILILVEDLYEDLEFWYPKIRLEEEEAIVTVAAPEKKTYRGKQGMSVVPDILVSDVDSPRYDALVIPGGYAPDRLRRSKQVLELVRAFDAAKKVIATICHGGWVLISAKIVKGRHMTGFFAIKDDLENAGVLYHDEPVVIDGNLISSRSPADLPQFCRAIIKALS